VRPPVLSSTYLFSPFEKRRLALILDPRGQVDADTENIICIDDDVADVDANAEDNIGPELARFRSATFSSMDMAQVTASTALANSASMPSPLVLTMRPRNSAMAGSTMWRRNAFSAAGCRPHRPPSAGIARDISSQHRCQSPFDTPVRHRVPDIWTPSSKLGV
jgi:hypothetical protein